MPARRLTLTHILTGFIVLLFSFQLSFGQQPNYIHPDTKAAGWSRLFGPNLSGGIYPKGIWKDSSGIITASQDETLWSEKAYDDFILDLEFMTAPGTNSGVIVHASDMKNWIPHSIEIQIADDYSEEWGKAAPSWQCAAVFGHQPASKRTVKKPGEWNHYTITCKGKMIWIALNGELVNSFDMNKYNSAKKNPDGTEVPAWLSNPPSELALHGHIGFQGKHAGAPIFFRNILIKPL